MADYQHDRQLRCSFTYHSTVYWFHTAVMTSFILHTGRDTGNYGRIIRKSASFQNISAKSAAGMSAALFHPFLIAMSHCQRSHGLRSMTASSRKKSMMEWLRDVVFPVNSCFSVLYSDSIPNRRSYSCARWMAFSAVTSRFVA